MGKADEIIKSVLSDKKLASSKVYKDEPLIFTASKMKNYTPPEYSEMKKLISGGDSVFMPSNEVFYIQGKFMENFTDSFDFQGVFVRYFPTYRDLSTSQLRGYFSWRTKLRQGNIEKAPVPFAFIYMYELINLIGVSSPEDGFLKLRDFSQRYGELDCRILAYSKIWLCDFAAYYGINPETALSLPAFGNDEALICLMKHREMPPEKIIGALEAFSSYKITKSSFYKKNPAAVTDTVCRLFAVLEEYYAKKPGGDIFLRLFAKPVSEEHFMFYSAVFYEKKRHSDCVYSFNEVNKYICRDGKWKRERFCPVKDKAGKLGALLKNTDYRLRTEYGFKSALKPVESSKLFDDAISRAVAEHFREKRKKERAAVVIDISKLGGIRRSADETRDKLIVEEAEEDEIFSGYAAAETDKPAVCDTPEPEKAAEEQSTKAPEQADASAAEQDSQKYGLDAACTLILKCLLKGEDPEAAARSSGIMLSVATDRINETLFDHFSDTVIEFNGDVPSVIEDYADELKGMFEI